LSEILVRLNKWAVGCLKPGIGDQPEAGFIYFIVIKALIKLFFKNYYVSVSILINNIFIFVQLKKRNSK